MKLSRLKIGYGPNNPHKARRLAHSPERRAYLRQTVLDASNTFGRVLAMPNLDPPIINWKLAKQYKKEIMALARPDFRPLFALYLTENTTPEEIAGTKTNSDFIPAYKLYPAGATTNSKFGVKS